MSRSRRALPIRLEAPYQGFSESGFSGKGSPRILVVKRGALGDILATTPLLRLLRQSWPDAFISWIAAEDTADLLAAHTDINELIVWNNAWWKRLRREEGHCRYMASRFRFILGLRARRFDILLSLEAHEMKWMPWFCGAPRRVGLWARGLTALRYQTVIEPSDSVCFVGEYLKAGAALGLKVDAPPAMSLPISDADHAAVRRLLADAGYVPSKPLIVVHPRTNWITKDWPLERFADVLGQVQRTWGQAMTVIVTGLPSQRAEAAELIALCLANDAPAARSHFFNAAGLTRNIRELAGVLEAADVALTGDTSAMHLAAAVGTPCVTVFGSTRWQRVAPPAPARLLPVANSPACGPCSRSVCTNSAEPLICLRRVRAEAVAEAVLTILKDLRGVALPDALELV